MTKIEVDGEIISCLYCKSKKDIIIDFGYFKCKCGFRWMIEGKQGKVNNFVAGRSN